jgi:hypothetical protein
MDAGEVLMPDVTLWSVMSAAIGFGVKSAWDSYAGYRDKIRLESWKIRADELDRRLSQFYWPLYIRLQRDDVIWHKVFHDLRSNGGQPGWAAQLTDDEARKNLAKELEDKVILPNHVEAVGIIRSFIHLANADDEFEQLLAQYVRHVDVYTSLRSAGSDLNPDQVGEPYPNALSKAVRDRLLKYQAEYEDILRDKGVLDLRPKRPPEIEQGARNMRITSGTTA